MIRVVAPVVLIGFALAYMDVLKDLMGAATASVNGLQLNLIDKALQQEVASDFSRDVLPSTQEEFEFVVSKHFEDRGKDPAVDQFGNRIFFERTGADAYVLSSAGPDTQRGTSDDMVLTRNGNRVRLNNVPGFNEAETNVEKLADFWKGQQKEVERAVAQNTDIPGGLPEAGQAGERREPNGPAPAPQQPTPSPASSVSASPPVAEVAPSAATTPAPGPRQFTPKTATSARAAQFQQLLQESREQAEREAADQKLAATAPVTNVASPTPVTEPKQSAPPVVSAENVQRVTSPLLRRVNDGKRSPDEAGNAAPAPSKATTQVAVAEQRPPVTPIQRGQDPERAAESMFKNARNLLNAGRDESARSWLEKVVERYPDTNAAQKARQLLGGKRS